MGLIYYSQWSTQQAELGSTAISDKSEPNKNNNTGWLRGIRTPSKQQQQQQPVSPMQQQQHPLQGMQQLPHHPPRCQAA